MPTPAGELLSYYASHGSVTDPGEYGYLFDRLPGDVPSLCDVIQGVLVHVWKVRAERRELSEERWGEVLIRPVAGLLHRILELDDRPLPEARPPERRMIVDCRHFSVLLCSILRHKGIPSRARVGFATWLEGGVYMDHWVCEYWNPEWGRWVLADPDTQRYDVPPAEFVTAGTAWRMCRTGEVDPRRFHLFRGHGGLWCVRDDLLHDLAALNKRESLSFDVWGLMERQRDEYLSEEEVRLLDGVARLGGGDEKALPKLRDLYESDARLRMPRVVGYYTRDSTGTVGPLATMDLATQGLAVPDGDG